MITPDASTPPAVALKGITKRFSTYVAVDDLSLEISSGSFVSLVGPSGCGKSTVLHIIAGLLAPSAGATTSVGHSRAPIAAPVHVPAGSALTLANGARER